MAKKLPGERAGRVEGCQHARIMWDGYAYTVNYYLCTGCGARWTGQNLPPSTGRHT